MSEWIKVSDGFPEPYEFVLVYAKMQGTGEPCPTSIARWNTKTWETICNDNNACACGDLYWEIDPEEITHWMPLPKPPEVK